jgi:hypothetical protein
MAITILAVRAAAFTAMSTIGRMAQSIGQHKTPGHVSARSWSNGLLLRNLFDTYRPELHYMRGPGPRWQQKYRDAKRPARSHS